MVDEESSLTRDPVFQVNACIWLVRTSRGIGPGARPIYRREGFDLRSLERRLAFSSDTRQKLVAAGFTPDPPEPDVLLRHVSVGDHLVLECKAQGFSSESTTALQGRKLLAACGDPDASLGTSGHAYVAYVLDSEDVEMQLDTLRDLAREVAGYGIEPAQAGVLGLSLEEDGLWAELTIPGVDAESSVAPLCKKILTVEGSGDELRPLYIIPFDPAAEHSQSEAERKYCARQLAERLFNATVSVVGRAEIPNCLVVSAGHLLREATFGVSDYWEVRDLKNFESRIAKFIYGYLNKSAMRGKLSLRGNVKVEINLTSEEDRSAVISMLQRGSPSGMTETLLDSQMDVVAQVDPVEFS